MHDEQQHIYMVTWLEQEAHGRSPTTIWDESQLLIKASVSQLLGPKRTIKVSNTIQQRAATLRVRLQTKQR